MVLFATIVGLILLCGIAHERRQARRHRDALQSFEDRLDLYAPRAQVIPIHRKRAS